MSILSDATRKPSTCYKAPLIEHLTNGQFAQKLNQLENPIICHGVQQNATVQPDGSLDRLCRCGCGDAVSDSRRFVSQGHYSRWLRLQWPPRELS